MRIIISQEKIEERVGREGFGVWWSICNNVGMQFGLWALV